MPKAGKRRADSVEAQLRLQKRESQFWRLFELQLGTRHTLLLGAVSIAIPIYILGSRSAFSTEWVWATLGLLVIMLAAMGLIPVYALRKHFVEEPAQVHRFMLQWKGPQHAAKFVPRLLRFVRDQSKGRPKEERKGVRVLLAIEDAYAIMRRHALWLFPLVVFVTGSLIVVARVLLRVQ